MALFVFLSVLGLALIEAQAQQPKPCVVPPLLTGDFSMVANDGGLMFNGHITYDSLGKRMRLNSYGVSLNGTRFIAIDQIMIFNQEVYYEIDWIQHSCIKRKLDSPFIPMQVPHDASFMGQVVAGSTSGFGMGVLVNSWWGKSSHEQYMTTVTEIGCLPLSTLHQYHGQAWSSLSMYNWVLGVADYMQFIPPPICEKATLEETEEADTFFTAIRSLAKKPEER